MTGLSHRCSAGSMKNGRAGVCSLVISGEFCFDPPVGAGADRCGSAAILSSNSGAGKSFR